MLLKWTWVMVIGFLVAGHVTLSSAVEMGPKKELPDDTLFQDSAAFCEGCYAVVQETEKLMTLWKKEKGSLEDHIDAAVLGACSTERLRAYVLSPPKMLRLCSGIRAHYMDQIGLAVLKHYSRPEKRTVDQLFQDICRKAIPACPKGITPMSVARQESRKKAEEERETAKTVAQETKKKAKKTQQDATGERASSEEKDEL